jgi:NADH-quinone oxidoreductase subunit L
MASAAIPSFSIWLVFIFPYIGALVTAALGKAGRVRDYLAVVFSLLSALFATTMLVPVLLGQPLGVYDSIIPRSVPWISGLGLTMGVLSDPYTAILTNVVAWVSFLIMVYCLEYMKGDSGSTRFFFFMNLFIGSMQLIVLSDNLLSLFVGWEIVGLCSYGLIGHYYRDETKDWVGTPGERALGEEQAYPPSHAGMKAFVMTRIGDVAMLAGILILFFYAGTFNYYQLASSSSSWAPRLSSSGLLVPVALLIFGGAVGKSAQFPLHEWLPDAMAGPAPVSALIHAATMVKAGVVLVARIAPLFYFAFVLDPSVIQPFFVTVAWIGAFTAFLAATQALVGFELKKILAYSTVSQIGYMMLAMGLAGLTPDFTQGLSAGLYHLLSHAIFKACLFLAAGALIHAADSKYISEMGGLRNRMKITFGSFLIAVASLSGIPPFSGFWSKDAVLSVAWGAGQYGLFVVGAATAGLTAFYSFRMLGMIFFGGRSNRLESVEGSGHHVHEPGPLMWIPYALLAGATVLIGLTALVGEVVPSLNIEVSLESAAATYVNSLFPSQSTQSLMTAVAFNVPSSGVTGLFVAVGFLVAVGLYVARKMEPSRLVGEKGLMHAVYLFLERRWYINAFYYKVFVNAPIVASRWLSESFDYRGLFRVNTAGSVLGISFSRAGNWIDARVVDGAANGISGFGQALSRVVRKIQTGVTEQYAQVFAIGVVVMVILLLLAIGVKLP